MQHDPATTLLQQYQLHGLHEAIRDTGRYVRETMEQPDWFEIPTDAEEAKLQGARYSCKMCMGQHFKTKKEVR
eukprot:CAMPEP_0184501056 /NCGR_PEP_ID=MMETSP0113_2-20130426/46593_1 /TAXON_ID=91329 /ORGANISM="Norrisiella sphaerica, Strain BC52" /LENGTH=72 /DNA_ID=CAMNT_0026889693 /DNA_START=134 /DNA_END=349 /DNA_ORIENTATION=+